MSKVLWVDKCFTAPVPSKTLLVNVIFILIHFLLVFGNRTKELGTHLVFPFFLCLCLGKVILFGGCWCHIYNFQHCKWQLWWSSACNHMTSSQTLIPVHSHLIVNGNHLFTVTLLHLGNPGSQCSFAKSCSSLWWFQVIVESFLTIACSMFIDLVLSSLCLFNQLPALLLVCRFLSIG